MKESDAYLKNSETFCMLPWVHVNLGADGKVLPCCLANGSHSIGSLRDSTLAEIWNSESMRRLRLNMLRGEKSPACSKCYQAEQAGIQSMRKGVNARFAHRFLEAGETRLDGGMDKMHVSFLDIRFSNLCNFKCRICGPEASSAWHEDAKALGDYSGPKILSPTEDPEELWRQIEPLVPDLEQVYFAGGEPLLSDDHYRILDLLIKKRRFDVGLAYNTNFSVMTHKSWDVMKLWDKFQRVEVKASLDGMGKRGEYLRKGTDWAKIVANRKRMLKNSSRIDFAIDATICLMNVLHLPDFHKEWLDQGLLKPGQWRPHMLFGPEKYSIQTLPASIKRKVVEKYGRHIEEVLKPLNAAADEGSYRSTLSFMEARDKSALLPKFRETTRALDKLRGENFIEIFPELASLMR